VKNRLTPYEAGWLTFLVKQGIASEAQARQAMNRVAQDAIDELNTRRAAEKARKKRKGQ
jgi:hypothetical protein